MANFAEHLSDLSGVSYHDVKNKDSLAGHNELRNKTYSNLVCKGLDTNFLELSGSTFIDCEFVCFTTFESDFSNSVFKNCSFEGGKFWSSSFKGCEFIDTCMCTSFFKSDLRFATFSNTDCVTSSFGESTNLTGADLSGANLDEVNLLGSVISDANLKGTCLDPTNEPNQEGYSHFVYSDIHNSNNRIGYRTACSPVIDSSDSYIVGNTYEAPVFSTSKKECHPGLYVYSHPADVIKWVMPYKKSSLEVLSVKFNKEDLHKAGNKYRVKKFTVNEHYMKLEACNKYKKFVR